MSTGPARATHPDGDNNRLDLRKRKHVSAACEACRKARVKCDGVKPCQTCVAQNIPCKIDESKDGRRGRKRTLNELHTKADALETLMSSLKTFDSSSIQGLIALIRKEGSIEDIIQHARTVQTEYGSRTNARVRHTVLDIASLIDEPTVRVPAKPWTSLTDDDYAVSHLISVYFAWQHQTYPSVDQDLFVAHMNSKDLSSRYCSPVLVNSMLLAACMYTDHPLAFANPDEPSTRALHFLEEATKLWSLEHGRVSLSNLQALPAFITGVNALGKDRVGLAFTNQCVVTSSDLVREVKKGLKKGHQELRTEEFQRSYALALWAGYLIQTEVAIAWSRPLVLQKPRRDCPYRTEELSRAAVWRPYPKAGPEISFYPSSVNHERFKLYTIASDLTVVALSGAPGDSPPPGFNVLADDLKSDLLDEVRDRLREWERSLPDQARLGSMDGPAPAAPLVDLHLAYHSFHISTAGLTLQLSHVAEEVKERIVADGVSACLSIADLIKWLQRSNGLEHFSAYFVHSASMSAYNLLPHMDRPGAAGAFHTMVVALSAAHQRWTLAHGIVRMLWIEVQRRDLSPMLDESTLSLLELGAVDSWGPEHHRRFGECAYPNYAAVQERGVILSEMGELLEEYSRLNVGNKSNAADSNPE